MPDTNLVKDSEVEPCTDVEGKVDDFYCGEVVYETGPYDSSSSSSDFTDYSSRTSLMHSLNIERLGKKQNTDQFVSLNDQHPNQVRRPTGTNHGIRV